MKNLFCMLENNNKNIKTITIFRYLLYSWFLLYYNTLAFNVDFFWGKYNFIPKMTTDYFFGHSVLNLFEYSFIENNPLIIILLLNVIIVFSFFNLKNRIFPIFIYFITLTLDSRSYYVLDGGNNLVTILTVFNIFFKIESDQSDFLSRLGSSLSNLFLLMAKIQVCIVYFVAGHAKLNGDLWSNGTALYYTLSVIEVSTTTVRDLVKVINPIFLVLPTYTLLLFQLSFPFMIWFKKVRRYYVFMGMLIHIGISFIMGLTFFGYALCISYFLFYDDSEANMVFKNIRIIKTNYQKLYTGIFRNHKELT